MDEYISREAIIEELEEEIDVIDEPDSRDALINMGLKIALRDVKRLPAADVQLVTFARWIDLGNRILCSGCGAGYDDSDEVKRNTYTFCPNCGAKMGVKE